MTARKNLVLTAAWLAIFGLAACTKHNLKGKGGKIDGANAGTKTGGPDEAFTPGVDVTEASLRGSEFSETPDLGTVNFDYDSFSLKQESLDVVKKNAEYLKTHRELEVLVAGHCDDRGTVEYNLALGQKRAKELREYYIRLGVNGKSIATISYGEEQGLCSEQTEECWGRNRRAETRVRSRTASTAAPNGKNKNK
jgi:peptidoglycan-associated lipoprotein